MTTPASWHEAAQHYLHREQRRPCEQCAPHEHRWVVMDDPNATGVPEAWCRDDLTQRPHDPDCIQFCSQQLDGGTCRIFHRCWCNA